MELLVIYALVSWLPKRFQVWTLASNGFLWWTFPLILRRKGRRCVDRVETWKCKPKRNMVHLKRIFYTTRVWHKIGHLLAQLKDAFSFTNSMVWIPRVTVGMTIVMNSILKIRMVNNTNWHVQYNESRPGILIALLYFILHL